MLAVSCEIDPISVSYVLSSDRRTEQFAAGRRMIFLFDEIMDWNHNSDVWITKTKTNDFRYTKTESEQKYIAINCNEKILMCA